MWSRTVWYEPERDQVISDGCPTKWLADDGKTLLWPPGSYTHTQRLFNACADPDPDTWHRYEVYKIKFKTDDKKEAMKRNVDTSAMEDDECDDTDVRKKRPIQDNDYVNWSSIQVVSSKQVSQPITKKRKTCGIKTHFPSCKHTVVC